MKKTLFGALTGVIKVIAAFVFVAGLVLTCLGGYGFVDALTHFGVEKGMPGQVAIGLLKAVDIFLIAIVFFVFSLGVLIIFNTRAESLPANLPQWLKIKDFIQLKVILWEAILTTLVILFLAGLVEKKINGGLVGIEDLIIPGCILLLALSLLLLKKGEHKEP